jgi:hypothetical protein
LPVPRSFVYALNLGWSAATTTGGSLTQAAYGQRIETSNGSAAGACTAHVAGERSRIGFPTGTNFSTINFANPIRANIILGSRVWTNADSRWAFIFGVTETAAAGFNNMIATGSSSARGWVGIQCVSGDIKLIAVDGTSAVAESAVLDTWADGGNNKGYSVLVDNGVATLLDANNAALGTLATSVPTTQKANYAPVVLAEASSTTTTQNGIIVQHLSFAW